MINVVEWACCQLNIVLESSFPSAIQAVFYNQEEVDSCVWTSLYCMRLSHALQGL